jgi:hypothetical protein
MDNIEILDYINEQDLFASLFQRTAKTLTIVPIVSVEDDRSLFWHYAIYDKDEILIDEVGCIGTIGALPPDEAKAVGEQVAIQEARRWIGKYFPDAIIEVACEGDTSDQ